MTPSADLQPSAQGEVIASQYSFADGRTAGEIVSVVENIVLQMLPKRPTLRVLAVKAGVATAEINLAFRIYCGVPVYRRLLSLRLEQADRLLKSDPNLPAEVAALQCGFGHFGVFNRNFRVRFGRDPQSTTTRSRR
jgi:transcriptional regulator GlxA family with amidase domain